MVTKVVILSVSASPIPGRLERDWVAMSSSKSPVKVSRVRAPFA